MIKLTVVTVFKLGCVLDIKRTIESVKIQSLLPYEHIMIISGVENEEALKEDLGWSKSIFVINKDKSIYDAMNIGLSIAGGDAILFLNGGDEFSQTNSIELIDKYWDSKDCLCFRVALRNEDDIYFRPKFGRLKDLEKCPSHQGFVAPLPEAKNNYFSSVEKPITADLYWMRELIKRCGCKIVPSVVSVFSLGGVSNNPNISSVFCRLKEKDVIRGGKEVFKWFLFKTFGKKRFYNIVYFNKYTHCKKNEFMKMIFDNKLNQ